MSNPSHAHLDQPPPPLPRRDPRGHKGTFGTATIIGGCCGDHRRMIGAPALAAIGALRAGAGLAKVLAPHPILHDILTIAPSATGIALPVDAQGSLLPSAAAEVLDDALAASQALAVGPGLGEGPGVDALALRCVQQEGVPVVVDADAINALARVPELWRDFRAPAVLTPHPGEFKRLADALRVTLDPINPATRPAAAEALAQRLGCVIVLKGANTVVSDGHRTWICRRGHPCLATAGTGDVLSGVIAGLLAQFGPPSRSPSLSIYDLARLAVESHARAGEAWAQHHASEAGLLATELAEEIPAALESLRAPPHP